MMVVSVNVFGHHGCYPLDLFTKIGVLDARLLLLVGHLSEIGTATTEGLGHIPDGISQSKVLRLQLLVLRP